MLRTADLANADIVGGPDGHDWGYVGALGSGGRNTAALDTADEEWLGILDVNLNGVFRCIREFGRHMVGRRSSSVVNIASMSGLIVNKPQPQAAGGSC